MIATGMATVIARPTARRTLRSRTRRPSREGPTPFTAGMPAGRGSIGSSLLGFGNFGADAVEKRPLRRQRRMPCQQRVRGLVRVEQQLLALLRRRSLRRAPEIARGTGRVAVRETDHRQAAGLTAVPLRVAPLSLLIGRERLAVAAGEKQGVAKVVVREDEGGIQRDRAPECRLGL